MTPPLEVNDILAIIRFLTKLEIIGEYWVTYSNNRIIRMEMKNGDSFPSFI